MPEVPLVFPRLIRMTFFLTLIADLCVPYYYAVQFAGLPWISARRLVTFCLIAPFFLAVASSSAVRRRIADRARSSSAIVICAVGFLIMAILSIPGSSLPSVSLSSLVDAILSWYVPFLAMLFLVQEEDDAVFILKIACFCAIFNSLNGMVEFRLQHRYLPELMPRSMLISLVENNPALDILIDTSKNFRNGLFRASSTFVVPLSFGEFEAIVIPIGIFFAMHRKKLFERGIGWAVVIGGMVGIVASGSRGAYLGFLISTAAFVAMWTIRKALVNRASLAPALVGTMGAVTFVIVLALVLFWPRAHNLVLGGGAEEASTQGRWDQWRAAWPLIKSNPITGHGFATGGVDIDSSIDSYVISLLVETGVPSLVFFAGISLLPIWHGVRAYLTDLSESGALAGALACSFIAFTTYRLALSQRENHMLMFSLLAIVVTLNYAYARKRAEEPRSHRGQPKSYSRAGESGIGRAGPQRAQF
jgi:hypothetical protein